MATEEGTKEIESGVDLAHQIAQSIDVLRYTINETVQSVEGIVNAASNQSICTNEVSEVISALDQGLTESAISIKLNLKTLTTLIDVSRSLKKTVMGREELIETRRYKD
jgi:methyl-accepting chemotaxis protein